jgi:glycerate 2-kinase
MKIFIAPDSFKESLSAAKAAHSIACGIRKAMPNAQIISIPMADGGEGTVEAMVLATSGRNIPVLSVDPLGREIQSFYGVLGNETTAVIEMAAASGLALLHPKGRNPMITSTFGTGLLIKDAIEKGFKDVIIGIGGSATNDGGTGMAMALGFRFLDQYGNSIEQGGGPLEKLAGIDGSGALPQVKDVKITVACDVKNPLFGPQGAAYVFARQKGADEDMVGKLDANLRHLAAITTRFLGKDISQQEGTGAAGGLGFGLMAFLGAEMKPGFDVINEITGLEEHIRNADLVITAEGKIDFQTKFGKTPWGIGQIAQKYKVPVIALAGMVGEGIETLHHEGITACFAIADKPMGLEESLERVGELLENKTEQIMRLVSAFSA